MAVHAQYPSNVLLLNRNVQEGNNLLENNYSFLDQSQMMFSNGEDLATQIRQQREEIEQFLQAQGEQLRRTLADKRQRQFRALLSAAEETAARKLREKEAEVDKAARRNVELEARAAQLTAQAHAWQARARAQEAAVAALREQLQQAIVTGARRQDEWGEEAEGGGEAEDAESVCGDPERVAAASGPSCKACRRRLASVVLLPCRHLCLCAGCGALAQSCPLCLAVRESSVEILLS
ncbi:hypothetical protein RHSIM_Rhsim07G0120500 [Rhododendron simsii]|uniref:RING-type domain-containing protein n=1 Tax=Rhododendron simsii TaxID=118357 RepID=A0A834GUP9_RHOSS|nr:hypothetical protein RHSIM_Rhsim07G0120500 [Rhododendron simsii]